MFDKSYVETILAVRLEDEVNAVLGVQAVYIAAICSALAFTGIIMILGMQQLFVEINTKAAVIGVILMTVVFLTSGAAAVWINKTFNYKIIERHLLQGRKFWK